MNLRKAKPPLPTFRSRSSPTSQQLLSSSLDSSLAFSERLAAWSGGDDRIRPFPMTFHKEWQHDDCKVMKWYKMQTQSSTKFDSIQHWQCNEPPFYHEYLVIKLTGGSLCRVERMGDGSRADALRWFGCHAHDIIQWFPNQDDYNKNISDRKSPKLVIEVRLPQQFDLLDVLAVCYSIQQHPKASKYTLQRYNCYFLCSTILAILTRRVAEWENSTTETDWTKIVNSTLDDLSDIASRRQSHMGPEYAMELLAFGILAVLSPDSQTPADFVLESLRHNLDSTALSSLNGELAGMLWQSDLPLTVESSLIAPLNKATRASLDSSDSSSVKLRDTVWRFGTESRPETNSNPRPLQKAMSKVALQAFSEGMKYLVGRKDSKLKMRQLEAKSPLHRRLAGSLFRLTVIYPKSAYKFVTRCVLKDDAILKIVGEFHDRFHVNLWQLFSSIPLPTVMIAAGTLFSSQHEDDLENDEDMAGTLDLTFRLSVDLTFPIAQQFINAEPLDIPQTLAFIKAYLMEDFWVLSVWTCVSSRIEKEILHSLSRETNTATVHVVSSGIQTDYTVADFQAHLRRRIQDHAQRVEQFQLAAASLVEEDIKRAISDVWRSSPTRPRSHIGSGKAPATSVVHQKFAQLPNIQHAARLLEHYRVLMR